ncbi:MAG: L-glutamate gamma-semialdehyde dehydrogenase [Prolixibacteraceae bacterium]|jgi:1-pyrroline-5-carboxylate dehydrogenase|nr:L-glutamate gamma-semialdehyde dehydrogenase [Prolixibacteraceae bacterium]MDI9564294.1 L-glutamate gamma-semialdehyde dehydrogenase [Bacteroidota bacterium]NLS99218.1 L-glutamate gamma-semialdehyde dehydrogenase [Bacteroidales bacterium]OQB79646.1 MAG: 1-pyrroline-5-carboxylate dehydrogenase 1 [Bacteroidetes bacterium ADurb.Bin123]HNZ68024.1 L-glutamate gamma-semialdehyde dehydrogenase [Prolixibacteraceae bacterium]
MSKGFFNVPVAVNEPVLGYAPGSQERRELQSMLKELRSREVDLPMVIGGKEVRTGKLERIFPPHEIAHTLGYYHQGDAGHVKMAIDAALSAREAWAALSWQHRASIFLKAADLLAGPYRAKMNAATILGQSKNAFQAEIDSACELADFFRFGVREMTRIYQMQPESAKGIWNYNEFRPLEGFVYALTPFNFTSIAGNLPAAPALMGNVVVWKPSRTAVYSAGVIMEIFREAGVPDGVINLVFVSGPVGADVVLGHPSFAGIHFTGSTAVFQSVWKKIGENIRIYNSYPRIVGETGGKDFIFADPTADRQALTVAMIRGAFEYQGQKCSAASRAYIPASIWPDVKERMGNMLADVKMGPPEDFTNFVNAVIDESSFDKLAGFIRQAGKDADAEVIFGGKCDKSVGYFIEPTVIQAYNPTYVTMEEELFGPVLTVYVYADEKLDETLKILDQTSIYALTGAIFSQNRYNIEKYTRVLQNAAGNFYINDKPTGAVVGQQPFGGARGSGTNDKAGSLFNMMRWVNIRTIKETFNPPHQYLYPNFAPDEN